MLKKNCNLTKSDVSKAITLRKTGDNTWNIVTSCPIAIMLNRMGYEGVRVGTETATILNRGRNHTAILPAFATEAVHNFDREQYADIRAGWFELTFFDMETEKEMCRQYARECGYILDFINE